MKTKELVFKLLNELKDKGISAYLVGGSSRDYLLNKDFNDIVFTFYPDKKSVK